MTETVGIKLATPDDAQAILELLKQLSQESSTILVPHLDTLTAEQEAYSLYDINDSTDSLILLAQYQDQPIGIVTIMALADQPRVGELGVAVLKEFWQNGIGSLLVDEATYWFGNYSTLQKLVLDVFKDNVPAIRLYQKYGFVKTGETKVTDQKGQQRAAVLMEFQPATVDHN
ncbi:GNAT family N-acetyltransferase [Limosilactobacillus mucosae]|uniref:GNAT family N-acetyltransferase n=1 Tax=Limosilactobacillus mucosae TaxID=97478 RepID=UPI003991B820